MFNSLSVFTWLNEWGNIPTTTIRKDTKVSLNFNLLFEFQSGLAEWINKVCLSHIVRRRRRQKLTLNCTTSTSTKTPADSKSNNSNNKTT
ncbi:hypothetical protein CVS40_3984 [Lucilia cuprina]|nr:hypothetical protein CVS40_3984 [Lucilia cuprina]